jgi:AraC-like DNA-binding protein
MPVQFVTWNGTSRQVAPLPIAAIESNLTIPTNRLVFRQARLIYVMEGSVIAGTATGSYRLNAGESLALGGRRWCSLSPRGGARIWSLYLDEDLLRSQGRIVFTDERRTRPGIHPDLWDGTALILNPGMKLLNQVEPYWRQMARHYEAQPELAAARAIRLFSHTVEILLPALLNDTAVELMERNTAHPIEGRLIPSLPGAITTQAISLLKSELARAWTVPLLSSKVAISRAQLTRLFAREVGLAPMQFLTHERLNEFTRLIEETDLPIGQAAGYVGWSDSRRAAIWFRRRFGITPSAYRRKSHPSS